MGSVRLQCRGYRCAGATCGRGKVQGRLGVPSLAGETRRSWRKDRTPWSRSTKGGPPVRWRAKGAVGEKKKNLGYEPPGQVRKKACILGGKATAEGRDLRQSREKLRPPHRLSPPRTPCLRIGAMGIPSGHLRLHYIRHPGRTEGGLQKPAKDPAEGMSFRE